MPDSILAVKKPGWFELRFVEDHKKVHSNCAVCGRSMWLPKSKSAKYVTCGGACAEARYSASGNQERHKPKEVKSLRLWECKECKKEHVGGKARSIFCGSDCRIAFQEKSKQALIAERSRSCVHCAAVFVARKSQIDDGHGKYCSQQCARDAGAIPIARTGGSTTFAIFSAWMPRALPPFRQCRLRWSFRRLRKPCPIIKSSSTSCTAQAVCRSIWMPRARSWRATTA